MRIGIDAKWFYRGPVSSQTVINNLLPTLFELYAEHEWFVFLDKRDKPSGFKYAGKNVKVKYVWGRFNMISNIFVLPHYLKRLGIDVFVYQTFCGYTNPVPSISFIHDVLFREYPQFFTWKERLYLKPLLWVSKFSTRIIATTNYVANDLIKFKYIDDFSKIDIVPLGVNCKYKPKEEHGPDKVNEVISKYRLPEKYILYVGRLNLRKNISALIKSLPHVQDKRIPIVIVGEEDWKWIDVESTISDLDLKERIIFTGRVSNEDLPAIYAASFIFCFPSFAEGFGLPPLEAMASGIPVIVSHTSSLPEVCGDAALYINPYEPLTISDAINKLMNDTKTYQELSMAAIAHARSLTWENTAHKFMVSVSNAVHQTKHA